MSNDPNSLVFSWMNITAWTNPTRAEPRRKRLLNNVCGIANNGCLMAVVSPSGGGKTTLLAVLGGRYKGHQEGEILLNGQQITTEHISYLSGFVCQKNLFFDELTVEEHLQFMDQEEVQMKIHGPVSQDSEMVHVKTITLERGKRRLIFAHLKMGNDVSEELIKKNIERVVENLVLSHRMHVKLSALSGGQVKRLALAVQLLTEPKILFCDEPTTGLDSYNAVSVVKLLRRIADQGKIVICAIHQPASGIFDMFDEVSLLVSNGSLAYHGAVTGIQDYFSRLGLTCPENYDLCEFVVSQVTVRPTLLKKAVPDESRAETLVAEFYQSEIYKGLEDKLLFIMNNRLTALPDNTFIVRGMYDRRPTFCTQLQWLSWRAALLLRRSWKTWALRFLLYFFVFCCLSLPFGVIKINQTGIQNMQGLLNVLQIELLYASMYGVIYIIPETVSVSVQEYADHLYSPLPLYLSHTVMLTTKALFEAFVLANYTFYITGLNTKLVHYVTAARPVLALAVTASAYGFFLSTAFDSITTASLFSVPFELIGNVFAGLFIRLTSLPPYLVWLKYFSLSYYTYEALSVNEWIKHDYIYCEREDSSQCYVNGDQVLALYGFSRDNIYIDYAGLIIYAVVLHSLGFFFLVRQLRMIAAY